MGRRITDLDSAEFAALFTSFRHTAYRLETLQQYGVGYEDQSFRTFLAGEPPVTDPARDEWTSMIRAAVTDGKTFQRIHLVTEPLSDYLRYELEWWYRPNTEAGDDVRILPQVPVRRAGHRPGRDRNPVLLAGRRPALRPPLCRLHAPRRAMGRILKGHS